MHDAEVRDERVIHVLPEEGGVFERVEGDAVGSVLRGKIGLVRGERGGVLNFCNWWDGEGGTSQFEQIQL